MEPGGTPKRKGPTMTLKKTYFPAKTFDDDFARLAALCIEEKWAVPTVDLKSLQTEVEAQRTARAEHDATEIRWSELHERFGLEQEARYMTYAAILSALRGLFRADKPRLAQLDSFTRSIRRTPYKNRIVAPPVDGTAPARK